MIRTIRFAQRIGIMLYAVIFFCAVTQAFAADNLECPETGPGRLPDLIGDTAGGGLSATENVVDLANEINAMIGRLEVNNPNIPWNDVQDLLIAAYCRVVAREPGLSASERWGRMRLFTGVLEREISAERLLPGRPVIARVPLPPDVYRELWGQAAVSHLPVSQFIAAILMRAAGR
jgi:hypothetical protein